MAEPLKNRFGKEIPARIAAMVKGIHPRFPIEPFVADALEGYAALDLMARGKKIAHALRRHLPSRYPAAIEVLLGSLGPALDRSESLGMAPFLYLPHTFFVSEFGLDHLEVSMTANYELTKRFTAEFSIRPFLERYPKEVLGQLARWTMDPSAHVRRLVSEGTRPRLPWGPRLRAFQEDPRPVLALLELLKDDPELYVRRSVANNLNDIGKDHPQLLFDTVRRWAKDAPQERAWVVRHALRSAVKRGERGALSILGYGKAAKVSVAGARITPKRIRTGGSVLIAVEIENTDARRQRVLVDLRVHFVKSSGTSRPKVFKGKEIELAAGERASLAKTISLAEMTTRKHYSGTHQVDLLLNGEPYPIGSFELHD